MTDPNDSSIERVRKLLAMAENAGATEEERSTFNAKATELMIKYAIDAALLRDPERIDEKIVQKYIYVNVPKSYMFEYVSIGCEVASALNCAGIIGNGSHNVKTLVVVGFESDVASVEQMYRSLVLQCTLELGVWYPNAVRPWMSGTDKFHAKRGFISGYAKGIKTKFEVWRSTVIADAGHGAEVALIDRKLSVRHWIDENMKTRPVGGRKYDVGARASGIAAGQRANIGGASVGGIRRQIGG